MHLMPPINRRTSGSGGLLFHRMVEAAVQSKPNPQ